jgi:hypothetical protein
LFFAGAALALGGLDLGMIAPFRKNSPWAGLIPLRAKRPSRFSLVS